MFESKNVSSLVAIAALFAGSSPSTIAAQNLEGTWQGTLHGRKDSRLQMKLSKTADNTLVGTLFLIDQSTQGFPVTHITSQSGSTHFEIPGIGVTYEAKFTNGAAALDGDWIQQSGASQPLHFAHVSVDEAWQFSNAVTMQPMSATADPAFELVTIKPSDPHAEQTNYRLKGRTFIITNYTVRDLIAFAHNVQISQIVGGPDWISRDHYDIASQSDLDGQPSVAQLKSMTRKLLATRFGLSFHTEKKKLLVYVLSTTKAGTKLTPDTSDLSGAMGMSFRGPGFLNVHNATMSDFSIDILQGIVLDRPVLDQTNLSARYDFTLNWTPEPFQFHGQAAKLPPPADPASAPPELFMAVQQQLGLDLKGTRSMANVLVLDHVDRPSPN